MSELQVDQSDWEQIRVTGGDRERFLQGMCTANVTGLASGESRRAAILNVKGRVLSIIEVASLDDSFVLICHPGTGEATMSVLSRYAIADDVEFAKHEGPLSRVWADRDAVWTAPPIFAAPHGPAASPEEVEIRRIEAGFPLYGVDVDESNFPFESLLDQHVDYAKGCFIGQEPVARVHARGSGQRMLRGIKMATEAELAVGAVVDHADKPKAGTVTSFAKSSDFGLIALAYVHRSAWEGGPEVTVGGAPGSLVELPFR